MSAKERDERSSIDDASFSKGEGHSVSSVSQGAIHAYFAKCLGCSKRLPGGVRAIATTNSGVATALGYTDGQIIRAMMLEVIERITRVVECPVTVDIEAGHENTADEMFQMIRAVITVGINLEDSIHQAEGVLVDVSFQVELIKALKELALSMDKHNKRSKRWRK